MMGGALVVVAVAVAVVGKGVAVAFEAEDGVGLLGGVSGVKEEREGWVASQSERSCSMGLWFMLNVPMRTTGVWRAMGSGSGKGGGWRGGGTRGQMNAEREKER